MSVEPLVTFVIATRNRSPILLRSLQRIAACGLPHSDFEIIVVDNASTDGTVERLARRLPEVRVISLPSNHGSCAKAVALPQARGSYCVFLDDDSFPLEDCVPRMIDHFQSDSRLGAAGFIVHLPGGGQECSALPGVFIGCGVGFRRDVLLEVGGLDCSYFMQAEEYDLSFRLVRAGYGVRIFEDLHALHLKSETARDPRRTMFLDVRNNLVLAATWLPDPWHAEFVQDWRQRYQWMAQQCHAERQFLGGCVAGGLRGTYRRMRYRRRRLSMEQVDHLFGVNLIADHMQRLKDRGVCRVLFADLGKNIYPYYRAAMQSGIHVAGILDDRFAADGRQYRGIAVVPSDDGWSLAAEAIVISNSSPVHAASTERRLAARFDVPIHRWHGRWPFEPQHARPDRRSAESEAVLPT